MRIALFYSLTIGCLMGNMLQAATIYVSLNGNDAAKGTNWATAKRTIQAGINAAAGNDTVLISNGVYLLANTIKITNYIHELRSLDGQNVIIDGNKKVRCLSAEKFTRLHGLTFRHGKITGPAGGGGGIAMHDGGVITDCRVVSNSALAGGGIYGYNITLSNCVVAHNSSLGHGGGMDLMTFKSGTIAILDTLVSNNIAEDKWNGIAEGGGIRISEEGGLARIINCRIINNRATGARNYNVGGGLYVNYATDLTVRNSLFSGNFAADNGGGAWVALGTKFENCTIAGNTAAGKGSGLLLRTQPGMLGCRVENSIIYSNFSSYAGSWRDNVYLITEAGASNWFENVWVGNKSNDPPLRGTNITYQTDPRFLNGIRANWRLSKISPCINAGTNRPWMVGARDLDRVARILNGIVDLGCHETDLAGQSMACFIVNPTKNQKFTAPAQINFHALGYSLKPLDVTQMVIYANNTPIASGRQDDLTGVWSNVWGGNYTLSCRVWNAKGHTIASAPTPITVSGRSCPPHVANDYDGDRSSDLALYRSGYWYVIYMKGGGFQGWFGNATCQPVEGDFDGDLLADQVIYQEISGYWGLDLSRSTTPIYMPFGLQDFRPIRGDFDGDGRADLAVYHAGNGIWYYRTWTNPSIQAFGFGGPIWTPTEGDYDGDGRTDFSVYNTQTGYWHIRLSTGGWSGSLRIGGANYLPAPGDYDGDYKTDFMVFAPVTGQWIACLSSYGYQPMSFYGLPGGQPVRGDFDGDGRADLMAYIETKGIWQGCLSSRGWVRGQFGGFGWIPIQ